MKKLISLLICIIMLVSAVGCKKEKYPEIESTKEEARVMMTFSLGNEKYEMKYELYRALFLNFSEYYDKGDKTFWNKSYSTDALVEINAKILEYTLDIFATLHVAKEIGFDPYSGEAEEIIADYIEKSVEGDGETITGFGGDYDAYLDSLKAANMNYSVHKLLLRYSIAYDKVIAHYEGETNESNPGENKNGALSFTRDDVLSFYNSESATRVSPVVLNASYVTLERAQEIRDIIASCSTPDEALEAAIVNTSASESDIMDGVLIGTHTLDKAYYANVTEAAFALDTYETSQVITAHTDKGTEYWILYKREKSDDHFDQNYSNMASVFTSQKIGEIINNAKIQLKNSLTETDAYKKLIHSEIKIA